MTTFTVEFRTENRWASKEIDAEDAADALRQARAVAADELRFEPYDGVSSINEIVVNDEEGQEAALWLDEGLLLRLGARDLLDAARAVVARWEQGDLAGAVRGLATAIARAESQS